MRPARLALVFACLAGAAWAQADGGPQISGTLDVGWLHSRAGERVRDAIESGSHTPSVINIQGREALGDGLSAVYRLKYGLSPDANSGIGATQFASRAQARHTYAGISGRFGTLVAGRLGSPIALIKSFDPSGGDMFSAMVALLPVVPTLAANPSYLSNAVRYAAPPIAGVETFVATGFGPFAGDDAAAGEAQERIGVVTVRRLAKPLSWIVAHERTRHRGHVARAHVDDDAAALAYETGPWRLTAMAIRSHRRGVDPAPDHRLDGHAVGINWSPTAADRLGAQYAVLHDHSLAAADAHSLALIYEHALSRRVSAYLGCNVTHNDPAARYAADVFNRPGPGTTATLRGGGLRLAF